MPLTGLPTPGSGGEFDTNLKIAAVLFLCWKGGAGRGLAPLNDLPTKNKAFPLRLLGLGVVAAWLGLLSPLRWSQAAPEGWFLLSHRPTAEAGPGQASGQDNPGPRLDWRARGGH